MTGKGKEADLPIGDAQSGALPVTVHPRQIAAAEDEAAPRSKGRGALSELTRNRIAVQLRSMYDTVAQQPVPDRFADLIARLDGIDRKKP